MFEPDEYAVQKQLVKDFRARFPAPAKFLFAVPNAAKRSHKLAAMMKAMGLRRGVPDLVLALPRGVYHGLFLELKVNGARPSESQRAWLVRLTAVGYCARCCDGYDEAWELLCWYAYGAADELQELDVP